MTSTAWVLLYMLCGLFVLQVMDTSLPEHNRLDGESKKDQAIIVLTFTTLWFVLVLVYFAVVISLRGGSK